jgi:hypothetical protein
LILKQVQDMVQHDRIILMYSFTLKQVQGGHLALSLKLGRGN